MRGFFGSAATPLAQSGNPGRPMPLEIAPDHLVAVVTQHLSDDLQGDHFTVAQLGETRGGTV